MAGILRYANQGATRNLPLVPGLAGNLESAVASVYGPGAYVQVYSGGQPGKGEGGARTGSIRHDHGRAADVRVFGADGNQISGDALAPLGQYWRANNFGGVCLEMHGGGIHLDDWQKPPPGGGMNWNYANQGGRYTDAMASAIAAGNKGVMPTLLGSAPPQSSTPSAPEQTGDTPAMAFNDSPRRSPAAAAIDQQTTGSVPASPASALSPASPSNSNGSLLGGILDFNNPQTLIALQLIANGQKAPGQAFDGIPELASYGARMTERKQDKAEALAKENQTAAWIRAKKPEFAQYLDAGVPAADVFTMATKPAPEPKRQWVTLPDGRYGWADERSGSFDPLGTATKPKETYRPLGPDEVKTRGLDPSKAYQIGPDEKVYAVGDAGVNITNNLGGNTSEFIKKSDEAAAKRFDTYVQEGNNSGALLSDMQQLTELGKQIDTGFGAQALVTMGPYAQALGLDIKGLAPAQAYQSIIDRLAPSMRPPGSGSSSDFDGRQFLSGLPSLGRTAEGNEIINQTLQGIAQTKMDAAAIARRAQIGQITWQQADEEIAKLPNPYQRFKSWQKDNGKTASTGSNQAPAADPDIDNLVDQYKTKRR